MSTTARSNFRDRCSMHEFRSTLLAFGANHGLNLEQITGHAKRGVSAVVRGYQGEKWVATKKKLIEQMHFDIAFTRPATSKGTEC